MKNEENEFIKEFHKIANKGWIKSISKSWGSVGLTFEKELNKTPDSLFFPDYYGIEIKCTNKYSHYPLFLFTVAFDGPTFPEINRIVEKYGYPDKDFNDKKVLFEKLHFNSKTLVNDKYKFQLELDKGHEKIYLCVYNLENKLIEKESYVYLDSLRDHLMIKLNSLAVVYASKKVQNNENYFRYYKLNMYNLISFEKFIELLNKDAIEISLIARIEKSSIDKGRYRNKNLVFAIKKDKIDKLFNKIYTFNYDYYK